jgi:hypothetical protein
MEETEEDRHRRELEILLRDTWIKEDPIAISEVDFGRLGLLMVNIRLYVPNNRNADVIGAPVPHMLVRRRPTGLYQIEGVLVSIISEDDQEHGFFRRKTRPREECVRAHIPSCGYLWTFQNNVGIGVFKKLVHPREQVIPVYAPLPYDVFTNNPLRKGI